VIAVLFCILGLAAAYFAGRRSVGAGCLVVIIWGYAFGIFRANFYGTLSYFTFDSAVCGLFLAQFLFRPAAKQPDSRALGIWLMLLIGWPMLLLLLPFQTFMVSLVGLRGNVYMLPALLLGSRLRGRDLQLLATSLAVLNLIAFGFGMAEYFRGIEPFYPYNAVTTTIYASMDAAGHNRVPATFANAHSYAAVMTDTLPFLFGAWVQRSKKQSKNLLLIGGMGSALVGVLMAATRFYMAMAILLVFIATLSGRVSAWKRMLWLLGVGVVAYFAASNERWQRYKTLADYDVVSERVNGSVNRSFLEILTEYPMGNGLGGGGTSIPSFLQSQIHLPIGVENEYARILLEEGIPGLFLWIAFALWFWTRRTAFAKVPWVTGRRMAWVYCGATLVSSTIGLGMLTSIPSSFLVMLAMGWVATNPAQEQQPAPLRNPIFHRVLTEKGIRYA
jgi:hypothetical protein